MASRNNSTLKNVVLIGGLAVAGLVGYNYLKGKSTTTLPSVSPSKSAMDVLDDLTEERQYLKDLDTVQDAYKQTLKERIDSQSGIDGLWDFVKSFFPITGIVEELGTKDLAEQKLKEASSQENPKEEPTKTVKELKAQVNTVKRAVAKQQTKDTLKAVGYSNEVVERATSGSAISTMPIFGQSLSKVAAVSTANALQPNTLQKTIYSASQGDANAVNSVNKLKSLLS